MAFPLQNVCVTSCKLIDLFTDTATTLNKFDLMRIIGCPGYISTFSLCFRALFGTFFLKFSQNKIVMGKKILVLCFDVIIIAFSSLVLEIWSFTVYFSGKKAIIITSKHGTRIFFSFTILFKENFKKKCPEKRSKIQTKCAHAPWASYNTP